MSMTLQVVGWPIVQDVDTGTYYVATNIDNTRTVHPRRWHIVEIEPLEATMMRMAREAGVFDWEADDE